MLFIRGRGGGGGSRLPAKNVTTGNVSTTAHMRLPASIIRHDASGCVDRSAHEACSWVSHCDRVNPNQHEARRKVDQGVSEAWRFSY